MNNLHLNNKIKLLTGTGIALVFTIILSRNLFLGNSPTIDKSKIADLFEQTKMLAKLAGRLPERDQNKNKETNNLARVTSTNPYPTKVQTVTSPTIFPTLATTIHIIQPTTQPQIEPTLIPDNVTVQVAQGVTAYRQGNLLFYRVSKTANKQKTTITLIDGSKVTYIEYK